MSRAVGKGSSSRRAGRRRGTSWPILAAWLFTACATAGGPRTEAARPPTDIDVDAAVAALQAAEVEYEEGRYEVASSRADSLYEAWRSRSSLAALADRALWLGGRALEAQGLLGEAVDRYGTLVDRVREGALRADAVERLVSTLAETGREPEAVERVLAEPGVLPEPSLDAYRGWVSSLSVERLRGFASAYPPTSAEASIVHAQLAQLLVARGEGEEARRLAEGVLAGQAAPPEREVADILVSAGGEVESMVARIGAILPLSGELSNIGTLLEEGMRLAVEAYRAARPDGFRVELVIVDDRSDPERAPALVEELESRGVVAIIGPLRSESFAAAAGARRSSRLPILSPTATEVLRPAPATYTLYDLATRELDVAVDLATWAADELGLGRAGVLVPSTPAGMRAATAFSEALERAGGRVVTRAVYDPEASYYQEAIETVAAAAPDIVFAPAPTPPTVLSLAPQLFYYGLDRSIVMGSESWGDPTVVRRLESFATDHRVVGLWLDRVSEDTPWQRFTTEYERTYRKSLRDNVLPGLSHDATLLVIAALERSALPIPAAVGAALAASPEIEGVTGRLRPDPATSTVRRATRIRMFLEGDLVEADRSELLAWLAETRAAPPLMERDALPR